MIIETVNNIAKTAEMNVRAEQGDYIVDGLLYCGKCNTPKQCRVDNPFVAGKSDIRHCMCKCRVDEINAENARIRQIDLESKYEHFKRHFADGDFACLQWLTDRDYKISEKLIAERKRLLKNICFKEAKMQGWTFDNSDDANGKIMTVARNYVDNFSEMYDDGKGLLLFGEVGTGKTYTVACIANALIDKGKPVLMTNFASIANTVQGLFEGRQEYYDSLNRFALLILDDLSTERKTEYMQEIVYNVIDSRYRAGLPLIVTTNLTSEELKSPAELTNKRTFSRLLEMCIPLEVEGKDRRREKLRGDYIKYKAVLRV